MPGIGKIEGSAAEVARQGGEAMGKLIQNSEEKESKAKIMAEEYRAGKGIKLRFDDLEMARFVNQQLTGSSLEVGDITPFDVEASEILISYYEDPNVLSKVIFRNPEVLASFFRLLPYGLVGAEGILQSGVSKEYDVSHLPPIVVKERPADIPLTEGLYVDEKFADEKAA